MENRRRRINDLAAFWKTFLTLFIDRQHYQKRPYQDSPDQLPNRPTIKITKPVPMHGLK